MNRKLIISLQVITLASFLSIFLCCGTDSADNSAKDPSEHKIPATLFGATIQWNVLGDRIVDFGELIRDRSFRTMDLSAVSFHPEGLPFEQKKINIWNKWPQDTEGVDYDNTIPHDSLENYPGNKYYPGYVNIKRHSGQSYTGINQSLFTTDPVSFFLKANTDYTLRFSSYGINLDDSPTIGVYITNTAHYPFSATKENINPVLNTWTHHEISLTTDENGNSSHVLAIYLLSNNDSNEILIDEVHFSETGSSPGVNNKVKERIKELGITSLRWPGGTLTDYFFWKESTGGIAERGELMTYNTLETPSLGLHEFLNLCEELNVVPLIQVNIFDSPENAADLVEYIIGTEAGVQVELRKANGRNEPWDVTFFAIGNEPSLSYTGSGLPSEAGRYYSDHSKNINSHMKNRAALFGKIIHTGGIHEPAFQIADWMESGSGSDAIDLLYFWNSQVFDPVSGIQNDVDFSNGHFYASRYWHDEAEKDYYHILSGGAVLRKTINEKVKPDTVDLPLWITEYHVTVENDSDTILTNYSLDFQSGLAIADMLISMIDIDIKNAYIHNLSQENCWGLLKYDSDWTFRPAGLVFKMLSVVAGEELLEISIDNNENYNVINGGGSVPSGFQYPVISSLATVNKINGRPRVIFLNRDYSNDHTVKVNLQNFRAGDAVQYLYNNASLSVNNETDPSTVIVTRSDITIKEPFSVTIPAHSLIRIDFK